MLDKKGFFIIGSLLSANIYINNAIRMTLFFTATVLFNIDRNKLKIDINSKSEKLNIRGGRYDTLIKDLGFNKNIPAVGAAINLKKI